MLLLTLAIIVPGPSETTPIPNCGLVEPGEGKFTQFPLIIAVTGGSDRNGLRNTSIILEYFPYLLASVLELAFPSQ